MQNPKYITAYETSFSLERADGTLRVVERDGPTDLLPQANVGEFGPVQPFDLALDVTPTPKLVKPLAGFRPKRSCWRWGCSTR